MTDDFLSQKWPSEKLAGGRKKRDVSRCRLALAGRGVVIRARLHVGN